MSNFFKNGTDIANYLHVQGGSPRNWDYYEANVGGTTNAITANQYWQGNVDITRYFAAYDLPFMTGARGSTPLGFTMKGGQDFKDVFGTAGYNDYVHFYPWGIWGGGTSNSGNGRVSGSGSFSKNISGMARTSLMSHSVTGYSVLGYSASNGGSISGVSVSASGVVYCTLSHTAYEMYNGTSSSSTASVRIGIKGSNNKWSHSVPMKGKQCVVTFTVTLSGTGHPN